MLFAIFQMDVECLLFTDLLLICKASKRMDKYKILKPPMRVDRIILHELKDKGKPKIYLWGGGGGLGGV